MHKLPFHVQLDTTQVLKKLNHANYLIGELKGLSKLIPNPNVILSIINLSESKDSSEIENIITTYDDMFKFMISSTSHHLASKEVIHYKEAIDAGVNMIEEKGFISTNMLVDIQKMIEPNKSGIRKLPGTVIINDLTLELVHTPPQHESEIRDYLHNLENYINDNNDYDPLIQMAIIHYQFESIHPFYDGNGRTGRILNIIYLLLKGKMTYPYLYLSKYILKNKETYYALLKSCEQDIANIKEFVTYILEGIIETSIYTIELILKVNQSFEYTKEMMKLKLPSIYKVEIINHLFSNIYTKNQRFREQLKFSRATATKYLKLLEKEGFIISENVGKEVIYKNVQFLQLFSN